MRLGIELTASKRGKQMDTITRMSILNSIFHVRDQSLGAIMPRLSDREAIERKDHLTDCYKQLIDLVHQLSEEV